MATSDAPTPVGDQRCDLSRSGHLLGRHGQAVAGEEALLDAREHGALGNARL